MLNAVESAMATAIAAEKPRGRQRDVLEILRELGGRLPVSGALGRRQCNLSIAWVAEVVVYLSARGRTKWSAAGWAGNFWRELDNFAHGAGF